MGAGLRFERTSGPSGFMEISCACTLIATPNVRATTGVVAGPLSSKLKTASTAAIVKFNSLTCRITFSFAKDPVRPCHWAAVELLYPWALFRFLQEALDPVPHDLLGMAHPAEAGGDGDAVARAGLDDRADALAGSHRRTVDNLVALAIWWGSAWCFTKGQS